MQSTSSTSDSCSPGSKGIYDKPNDNEASKRLGKMDEGSSEFNYDFAFSSE